MTLEFHFTDTPPQEYLDGLHSIDVPKLYDPMLSKRQRGNLLVLVKKRLSEWQDRLRTQIKSIEERYDNDNKDQAKLLIAPYKTLDNLGRDLNKAVNELERTVRAGRAVPQGFTFGSHIFGELERGEWHLGEAEDARRWDDYAALRRRMEAIGSEYKPLLQYVKVAQQRVREHQEDLKSLMSDYKARTSPLNILIRVLPVLLVVVFTLALGWYTYRAEDRLVEVMSNQAVGGLLLLLGLVGAIMMIVLARRRSRHIDELKQDIREGKRYLKELKAGYKQARLDFYPTDKLYKELRADYKVLKATF